MRLLLTSAGIKNASIARALVELLGKPVAESSALVIPTAAYPAGGPAAAWRIVSGNAMSPLCEIGWRSLGLLELTALPSIDPAQWVPLVQETDALLVGGGDPTYLAHWLQQSGLADLLPSLEDTVWVGVSAGSLVAAPHLGQDPSDRSSPTGAVEALGLVDFGIFPHLDNPTMPEFGLADAERWAAALDVPGYAIDDETAITVVDGEVAVVSEGHWNRFDRPLTGRPHRPGWSRQRVLEAEGVAPGPE